MRNVALVVMMASCVCSIAEEGSLPVRAKEYFMSVLRDERKENRDFSWQVSRLYGFTLRQIKSSTFFFQEGKSFEQTMNEAIAFESKKGRFFRAILLVALAGDLDINPFVPENVRAYLDARCCSSCGKCWVVPRAYTCCRCTAKGVSPRCVLKNGHLGDHVYDLWVVLGPMPGKGETQLIPYGP